MRTKQYGAGGRQVNRKGASLVFFSFMAAFVVAGALGANFMFDAYMGTVEIGTTQDSQAQYANFALREELLNANCATVQRGIFRLEAIENGDQLNCIAYREPVVVSFSWWEVDAGADAVDRLQNFDSIGYRIAPGSPSDVSQEWLDYTIDDFIDSAMTSQNHPIVVWDQEAGRYYRGVLSYTE